MKKIPKFEFTLSGFIIALILVSMFSVAFAYFISDFEAGYNVDSGDVFSAYNESALIVDYAEDIKNATSIQQQEGILDVIGGYFSAGYSALKISLKSFSLFENLMDSAAEDVEVLSIFKVFIIAIIIIAIFVGVVITVLVKMRV